MEAAGAPQPAGVGPDPAEPGLGEIWLIARRCAADSAGRGNVRCGRSMYSDWQQNELSVMPNLSLAVHIADVASEARHSVRPIDVDVLADVLLDAHPEADASRSAVVEVLTEEGVGQSPTSPFPPFTLR
jgi:hypothetical protein